MHSLIDGDFTIEPGTEYSINGSASGDYVVDEAGALNATPVLDGQSEVVIRRAHRYAAKGKTTAPMRKSYVMNDWCGSCTSDQPAMEFRRAGFFRPTGLTPEVEIGYFP